MMGYPHSFLQEGIHSFKQTKQKINYSTCEYELNDLSYEMNRFKKLSLIEDFIDQINKYSSFSIIHDYHLWIKGKDNLIDKIHGQNISLHSKVV